MMNQKLKFLLLALVIQTCLSLPVKDADGEDFRQRLEELLEQLKEDRETSSRQKESPAVIPLDELSMETVQSEVSSELETPLPQPRKRNCNIGLSNDCGAAHTAYMSGLKNFLSSKRRFDDTSSRNRGAGAETRDSLQSALDSLKTDDLSDAFNNRFILYYLRNSLQKQIEEKEREDALCMELTGLPCGQIWSNEKR